MTSCDPKISFGVLLRKTRESRGLSQVAAAKASGLSREHYGQIELGELPKLQTMVGIRSGLELTDGEWYALLSRYLTDCGATSSDKDSGHALQAAREASAEDAHRLTGLLDDLNRSVSRMSPSNVEFFRKFAQMLADYPALFTQIRMLLELDARIPRELLEPLPTPDSTIPKPRPESPGQPAEPVMATLLKKKAAGKAARS